VEEVYNAIDGFFTTGFLFWIEVLVLTGKLYMSVYALNDIEKWYAMVSYTNFLPKPMPMSIQTGVPCKWISDSRLFVLDNFDGIQNSPFRIYNSAFTLCPPSFWVHKCYAVVIKAVVGSAGWGTCICSLLW